MSNDPITTSNLCRSMRLTAGLTQEQLAERLGTTQSKVSSYERAKKPRVETICKVADACGMVAIYVRRGEWAVYAKGEPITITNGPPKS